MKQIFCKIGLGLTVLLVLPFASSAKNRYQSDLLSQMAESLQMKAVLDTLSDGSYIAQQSYKSHPLSIIVSDGEGEHIGYSIFSKEMRAVAPSPVYNFLERYALQANLSLKRMKSVERQLYEDDVIFTVGNIYKLSSIWAMPNVNFSIDNGIRMVRFFAPSVFLLTIIFFMEQILSKTNDVCWMTCEE